MPLPSPLSFPPSFSLPALLPPPGPFLCTIPPILPFLTSDDVPDPSPSYSLPLLPSPLHSLLVPVSPNHNRYLVSFSRSPPIGLAPPSPPFLSLLLSSLLIPSPLFCVVLVCPCQVPSSTARAGDWVEGIAVASRLVASLSSWLLLVSFCVCCAPSLSFPLFLFLFPNTTWLAKCWGCIRNIS